MITPKKKLCISCNTVTYLWSKGRCKACASKSYKKIENKKTPINKISDKRKEEQKSYTVMRRLFLEANPECACGGVIEGCDGMAVEVHHSAGRTGDLYLNIKYWKGLTSSCHHWVELNPVAAKKMGLSVTRIDK